MDTLADEVLQLGALSDAGVVKQGRADLGHHLLYIPGVKTYTDYYHGFLVELASNEGFTTTVAF